MRKGTGPVRFLITNDSLRTGGRLEGFRAAARSTGERVLPPLHRARGAGPAEVPMRRLAWPLLLLVLLLPTPGRPEPAPALSIETPMSPPAWALLERELLRANTEACREFFTRYFDERGYLECVERWGGDDGPDDAIENCTDWPLLHALGAPNIVRQMYTKAWEGHLRQYTA